MPLQVVSYNVVDLKKRGDSVGCRVKGMTTQEYRASYNYREEYFKRNPGLFGCIWFCSQCYRPLFGRDQVVIDHIVPLNKGGKNHVSNCTACCRKCNAEKSDKVDGRVIKGQVFKVFEQSFSNANRGVGGIAKLGVGLTAGAINAGATVGVKAGKATVRAGTRGAGKLTRLAFRVLGGVVKMLTFPLRKGSFLSRLVFLGIYVLVAMYYLQENTTLLNAWLR